MSNFNKCEHCCESVKCHVNSAISNIQILSFFIIFLLLLYYYHRHRYVCVMYSFGAGHRRSRRTQKRHCQISSGLYSRNDLEAVLNNAPPTGLSATGAPRYHTQARAAPTASQPTPPPPPAFYYLFIVDGDRPQTRRPLL